MSQSPRPQRRRGAGHNGQATDAAAHAEASSSSIPSPRATRERLIDAAFERFSRQGFHAVGLDTILTDVGVSKQTFYNHFESKDELILEVLAKRSHWELQTTRELLHEFGGDDAHKRLASIWDVLDAYFNRGDFRGCLFITAAAEFPSPHDPAHQAAATHSEAILRLLRDLAVEAGATDPQALAEQLMLLVDGAMVARHVSGNTAAAHVARRTAQVLVQRYVPPKHAKAGHTPGLDHPMPDPAPPLAPSGRPRAIGHAPPPRRA